MTMLTAKALLMCCADEPDDIKKETEWDQIFQKAGKGR